MALPKPSSPTATILGYASQAQKLEGLQEGLAKREAALWLAAESLTLEYAGETLSRYDVQYVPDSSKLKEITRPRLFETSYMLAQFRLFDLEDALGEGWLKALKLEEYAPPRPQWSQALQQVLFTYTEVI